MDAVGESDRPSVMMMMTCWLYGRGAGRKTCWRATPSASARFVAPPLKGMLRTAFAAEALVVYIDRPNMSWALVEYWTAATRTAPESTLRLVMTLAMKLTFNCQSEDMILELSSNRKAMSTVALQKFADEINKTETITKCYNSQGSETSVIF